MDKNYEKWLEEMKDGVHEILESPFGKQEALEVIAVLVDGAEYAFTEGAIKKQHVYDALEYFNLVSKIEEAISVPFVPGGIEATIFRWALDLLIEQAVANEYR